MGAKCRLDIHTKVYISHKGSLGWASRGHAKKKKSYER